MLLKILHKDTGHLTLEDYFTIMEFVKTVGKDDLSDMK